MALYVGTLHVFETKREVTDFNAEHYDVNIYSEEFAILYGVLPVGLRFETATIHYRGARNTKYENALADMQRNDLRRAFSKDNI